MNPLLRLSEPDFGLQGGTRWFATPLLLCVTLGCTASSTLRVRNTATQSACYVYISPSSHPNWGADQLGRSETIAPGHLRSWSLEPGRYDIRVDNCSHQVMREVRRARFVEGQRRTLAVQSDGRSNAPPPVSSPAPRASASAPPADTRRMDTHLEQLRWNCSRAAGQVEQARSLVLQLNGQTAQCTMQCILAGDGNPIRNNQCSEACRRPVLNAQRLLDTAIREGNHTCQTYERIRATYQR